MVYFANRDHMPLSNLLIQYFCTDESYDGGYTKSFRPDMVMDITFRRRATSLQVDL